MESPTLARVKKTREAFDEKDSAASQIAHDATLKDWEEDGHNSGAHAEACYRRVDAAQGRLWIWVRRRAAVGGRVHLPVSVVGSAERQTVLGRPVVEHGGRAPDRGPRGDAPERVRVEERQIVGRRSVAPAPRALATAADRQHDGTVPGSSADLDASLLLSRH